VYGLQETFGDRIDFIHLNVDLAVTNSARERFGLTNRSQYLLVDPQGNIIDKWTGFLDQTTVEQAIQTYLDG
jgi:hypothetical protein